MRKKSPLKSIIGLLLILTIILAYFAIIAIMGYKSGGGFILILPVFLAVKYLWSKLIVQKPNVLTQNNNIKPDDDNIKSDIVETPIQIYESAQIEGNTLDYRVSRGYYKRVVDFLTFQSPTYRSVFDEGQRRVVMVVSLIAPFLMAYLWFYDFNDEYLPSDWSLASPIFYVIFHLISLVYIWIREGSGNVRPGGNALKTIRNFILPLFIGGIIIVSCAFIYDNVYIPQQHEKEMRRKFEQYHNNLVEKNWLMMESILSYNINGIKPSEYIKGMENYLKDREFTKWEITDVIKKDGNTLVGNFSYTIKNKKEVKSKNITTTITFTNLISGTAIEKIEFTGIE